MNIKRIILYALALFISIGSFYYFSNLKASQAELDFPFELKEVKVDGYSTMWRATVIISPVHFSKNNLDQLFAWYSRKHPDGNKIEIIVYADRNRFLKHSQVPIEEGIRPATESIVDNTEPLKRAMPYDAICWRQGDGLLARNGDNLWYSYIPDLSAPYKTQRVVLRGRDYFSTKKVLESWEASTSDFKISVSAYKLINVEPAGTYYTFSSGTRAKNFDDMDSVVTIRRDIQIPIPHENVKLIGDKIGYIFMGWVYAVTTDGGKTWTKWDAEQALPNWQCCNQNLIRSVTIESNGIGTMTLNLGKDKEGITLLRTQDYGKTWA